MSKEQASEQEKREEKKSSPQWYRSARPIIGISIISLLICGLFFPLLVTGVAQATMPYQANGELVHLNGRTVGSYLIDNNFTQPIFFHARNETNPENASASLVDPDITVDQAISQVSRISGATGIPVANLTSLVKANTEGTFWIFGSPYVNVLNLNLILIKEYHSTVPAYTVYWNG